MHTLTDTSVPVVGDPWHYNRGPTYMPDPDGTGGTTGGPGPGNPVSTSYMPDPDGTGSPSGRRGPASPVSSGYMPDPDGSGSPSGRGPGNPVSSYYMPDPEGDGSSLRRGPGGPLSAPVSIIAPALQGSTAHAGSLANPTATGGTKLQ